MDPDIFRPSSAGIGRQYQRQLGISTYAYGKHFYEFPAGSPDGAEEPRGTHLAQPET